MDERSYKYLTDNTEEGWISCTVKTGKLLSSDSVMSVMIAKFSYEENTALHTNRTPNTSGYLLDRTTNTTETVSKDRNLEGSPSETDREKDLVENEAFNSAFVELDVSQTGPIPNNRLRGQPVISRRTVLQKLKTLKANTFPGPASVSPVVLRQCTEVLNDPL